MTYPDGTVVDRTYTDRGQLHEVKVGGTTVNTRTYDSVGRLSTSNYNNGVNTTFNYRSSGSNKDNMLDSIATTNPGTNKVGTYSYSYDANKNKTAETITGSPLSNKGFTVGGSGYDDDDRLVNWNRDDGNLDQQWTLSDVGDWTTHTVNTVATTRTHSDAHEVTAVGSSPITYDVKGNLSSDSTKSQDYTWDFDNRLSSVDADGDNNADLIAKYDALGRRVQFGSPTSPKTYAYSGQQVVSRYDNGGGPSASKLRWVFGSYIDEPIVLDRLVGSTWNQFYYSRNHQYSVTALTDTSGDVAERYAYDAYGNTTIYAANGTTELTDSAIDNPFTFTGRFNHSDLKLQYFRARMYAPGLGRFITRDPLGYVDGMSLYRGYFAAKGLDPDGLRWRFKVASEISEKRYSPDWERCTNCGDAYGDGGLFTSNGMLQKAHLITHYDFHFSPVGLGANKVNGNAWGQVMWVRGNPYEPRSKWDPLSRKFWAGWSIEKAAYQQEYSVECDRKTGHFKIESSYHGPGNEWKVLEDGTLGDKADKIANQNGALFAAGKMTFHSTKINSKRKQLKITQSLEVGLSINVTTSSVTGVSIGYGKGQTIGLGGENVVQASQENNLKLGITHTIGIEASHKAGTVYSPTFSQVLECICEPEPKGVTFE